MQPGHEFFEGEAVVLHGLSKSPELNFQSGSVVGFDAASSRFMVKRVIDASGTLSDKALRIKACSLRSAADAVDISSVEAAKSVPYKCSEMPRRSCSAPDSLGLSGSMTVGRQT